MAVESLYLLRLFQIEDSRVLDEFVQKSGEEGWIVLVEVFGEWRSQLGVELWSVSFDRHVRSNAYTRTLSQVRERSALKTISSQPLKWGQNQARRKQ